MNIKNKILAAGAIALMGILTGCLKDEGNYDYDFDEKVVVDVPVSGVGGFLGDTIVIEPTVTFANPADSVHFEHEWYIHGALYSQEPILRYVPTVLGNVTYAYYLVDRRTGIRYGTEENRLLTVSSPFAVGWGLLYERNGASEIAHINIEDGEGIIYEDLYQQFNDGESLGSQPVRIQDYQVTGGRGMFILQHGGQGSVELDATSMKKRLVVSEAFTGAVPADFKPVDFVFSMLNRSDLLINEDGRVFTRTFPSGTAAFTYPWISTPVHIPGGIRLTEIWDSWSVVSWFALTYDELNKRVLSINLGSPSGAGGINIMPLAAPAQPYPEEYTPLHDFGDWEYRWGGTFSDQLMSMVGAVIMRNPADGDYYFQTFQMRHPATPTPRGTRVRFSGSDLIRDDSKFEAIKPRQYIFFSSGNDLYYYDAVTGETKLYAQLESKITVLRAHDQGSGELNRELAVGLENGTFIVFDVTNPVLISGQPSEVYRATGFGRLVDIVRKGGRSVS